MAKSKKKASTLRFAQRDYDFCSSRPSSSNAQRTLRRSVSPHSQNSSGPSRSASPPSAPPRTTITLADVVNSNCEARVSTKRRKRAFQRTPPAAPPSSSSKPCAHPPTSPASIRPRGGPSVETGSLSSRFGAGKPMVGTAPSPSPPAHGQASPGNLGPSSSHHHTGTTIPSSPPLVYFPDFTATSSCQFLEADLGVHKELWRSSLIGFIAGKFPGYASLSQYVNSTWKCNVNLSMHDSGWLIFKFESELDMNAVLNGGPYSIYGRLLILKPMPDYFDFDTSELIRMPVWVRFPNLPLQCWSPLCLSKLASVIGKPVHSDTPTASMTRLSYARVLIDIDLLAELPSLIDITLPNGVTKSQAVMYESLPRFCKLCKTLGHSTSACHKASSHKRKKRPPPPLAPSGCSNTSADTEAVEKQPLRKEVQGEPGIDPMDAEAAVVIDKNARSSLCKRAKLAAQPGSPDAQSGSPQVVQVSEGCFEAATASPPRRQYLTRSKAAANSTFGRPGKSLGLRANPSLADSRIQGSTTSTPSSSL